MPRPADNSARELLLAVRQTYPDVPFIALGQTVLWDEPTKAIWHSLMEEIYPEGHLVGGVHNTDYFAKTSAHVGAHAKYVAVPHDDGKTRDLWSAAGEISCLFGSESVPTRQMYLEQGVPFDWLSENCTTGKVDFIAAYTAAWGWLGLVQTTSQSVTAHDIKAAEVRDALVTQIDWALEQSLCCLGARSREKALPIAEQMRQWVLDFLDNCTERCGLSDLYCYLLPKFYALLLAHTPALLTTTTSTELFQFNTETCFRPRFQVLAHFLNPATRHAACHAYNVAVRGSGIYALDEFGIGAVPFDVVVPGIGRGTLKVVGSTVTVEFNPVAQTYRHVRPIASPEDLAQLLEAHYGPDVVVVGKAVTLIDMIAAEFLIVFHESASGYTHITRAMNDECERAGIRQTLYPIVRLGYSTWESLESAPADVSFRLPPHLAQAFGREDVTAAEFGREWKAVVTSQREVTADLKTARGTGQLLHALAAGDPGKWQPLVREYGEIMRGLKAMAERSAILGSRQREHMEQAREWAMERQRIERRSGDDWRKNCLPFLPGGAASGHRDAQQQLARQLAIRETAFEAPLSETRERIEAERRLAGDFKKQRRLLERSKEALALRARLHQIAVDAEMERLNRVRYAYAVEDGLMHGEQRPTGWWIPLVDPSGSWFHAMRASATARWEPLQSIASSSNNTP